MRVGGEKKDGKKYAGKRRVSGNNSTVTLSDLEHSNLSTEILYKLEGRQDAYFSCKEILMFSQCAGAS